MKSFIVSELENGVLVSLGSLIKNFKIPNIERWQLRNLELHTVFLLTSPFGEIEQKSCSDEGMELTNEEFLILLKKFPQIVNGEFYAYSAKSSKPVAKFFCEDAAQWEVFLASETE